MFAATSQGPTTGPCRMLKTPYQSQALIGLSPASNGAANHMVFAGHAGRFAIYKIEKVSWQEAGR